jgi:hypothetical protein
MTSTTITLDTQLISDLLVSAFEHGGSSYWFGSEGYTLTNITDKYPLGCRVTNSVGAVFNLDSLVSQAGPIMQRHAPRALGRIVAGDWDASDADVFLQAALLGEIIYG